MNSPKPTNGFTLVEALIVSVIVAIIGITALVTYSGYVKESRRQAVEGIAEAAAVAANAYVRKVGSDANLDATKLGLFLTSPADYAFAFDKNKDSVTVTYTKNSTTIIVSKPY